MNFTTNQDSDSFFDNLIWMNSVDAAKYLRISVGALRIAVYRGQLKSRKWRRKLYFKRAELDRLIETGASN